MGAIQKIKDVFVQPAAPQEMRSLSFYGKSIDNPANSLQDVMKDQETRAPGVNFTTAMGLSTISSCVKIIAEDISTPDIYIEKKVADDRWERDYKHYLNDLFQDPSDRFGLQTVLEAITGNAALSGNGLGIIRRNRTTGQVIDIDIRDYTEFNVYQTLDRSQTWYYTVDRMGKSLILHPHEVLHIMAFTLNGWTGISPVSMAAYNVSMGLSATKYAATNYANGGFGGGTLDTDDEMDPGSRLKFARQVQQAQRLGLMPVLDRGIKMTPNKISPKDIEFVQTMKWGKGEMASAYRMPLGKLSSDIKMPGSSMEQINIQYATDCLLPWARRWETEMERKFFTREERSKYRIKFDLSSKHRADTNTMANYWSQLLVNQVLVPNEVRQRMGLAPREGGDEPIDHQKSAHLTPGGPNINTITKQSIDEEE